MSADVARDSLYYTNGEYLSIHGIYRNCRSYDYQTTKPALHVILFLLYFSINKNFRKLFLLI